MQWSRHEGGYGPGQWHRMAAAAVAAVALLAVGCGGGNEPAPARPIGAGPTSTSSGAASPTLAAGPLAPGTYTTVKFRPQFLLPGR